MKKIGIIILFISIIVLTGCENENKSKEKVIIDGKTVNTSTMEHKHCTRQGNVTNGEVSLNYDIYYTGDRLNVLKAEEKVTSKESEILDTYENAYKQIHSNYEGLEYYDAKVERDDTSITSTISIDYDNINIDKLISIEGEEDNIFENKIPKVDKWIELAKKFGTKCEKVED